MFESDFIAIVASSFLLAGMVKGGIGLGLPAVSLGLLRFPSVAFGKSSFVALLVLGAYIIAGTMPSFT